MPAGKWSSRWSSTQRTAVSVALGWVIPTALAGIASLLSTSVSGLHGVSRTGFFVCVFLAAFGIVMYGWKIALAFLPTDISRRLELAQRRDEKARRQEGLEWQMRTSARSVAAELSSNLSLLRDTAADRSYSWSSFEESRLNDEAWKEHKANLAGAPGSQEAFRLASNAYHEFTRISQAVAAQQQAFPQVWDTHRLDRVITAADEAERSVTALGDQF